MLSTHQLPLIPCPGCSPCESFPLLHSHIYDYCHCSQLGYAAINRDSHRWLPTNLGLKPFYVVRVVHKVVMQIYPLGLGFSWTVGLCTVSYCSLLWWSPFSAKRGFFWFYFLVSWKLDQKKNAFWLDPVRIIQVLYLKCLVSSSIRVYPHRLRVNQLHQ